jgi:hypothetical protein
VGKDLALPVDQGAPVLEQHQIVAIRRHILRAFGFEQLARLEGALGHREHPSLKTR